MVAASVSDVDLVDAVFRSGCHMEKWRFLCSKDRFD